MLGYFLFPTIILSPWWLVQKVRKLDPKTSADRRYHVWKYLASGMLVISVLGAGSMIERGEGREAGRGLAKTVVAGFVIAAHGKSRSKQNTAD